VKLDDARWCSYFKTTFATPVLLALSERRIPPVRDRRRIFEEERREGKSAPFLTRLV
jgi:hypothetical protein